MPADRETALLLRVKEGDRSAFEELFRLYERPLGGYLWRLCGDRALAEDLLQDCFLRIWKAAPSWEPAARVSTWIFRIAHNLRVNEAVRRKDRPEPRPEPSPPPDLEALQRAVQSAMGREAASPLLVPYLPRDCVPVELGVAPAQQRDPRLQDGDLDRQ